MKRDCGKRYAIKAMRKQLLMEFLGDELWEAVALVERRVLVQLHHPLLATLAYAFQVRAWISRRRILAREARAQIR